MRTKPIHRDEIRFNGGRITTLPIDSVRESKSSFRPEPIKRLWAPLLRSLNRARRKTWEKYKKDWDQQRGEAMKQGVWGFKEPRPPEPVRYPYPAIYGSHQECRHCGREFLRVHWSGHAFCSDRCASRARSTAQSRAKSSARARKRAEQKCLRCGAPLKAQRSTMRFCSTRCRVAAHRAR